MGQPRLLNARELRVMDRIEKLLDQRNTTWAQLARDVGKSNSSGSQWSGRRSFPREQTLFMIAQKLGISMGWLLEGDEPAAKLAPRTKDEAEVLTIMQDMTPDERRALLATARGLKGSLTKK